MNIDQLKNEWKRYDEKLSRSLQLNDRLILSMLKERSRSRIEKINRQNTILLVLMIALLGLIAAIFAGNPFDFRYQWQFIPYVILTIGVLWAIVSLIRDLRHFRVDINSVNLGLFLNETISQFEKSKRMQAWFGAIMFSAGILTVFSFLPKKLETKPIVPALAESMVMILITVGIYFLAFKFGAFKQRGKGEFENDRRELNELKALSADLGKE